MIFQKRGKRIATEQKVVILFNNRSHPNISNPMRRPTFFLGVSYVRDTCSIIDPYSYGLVTSHPMQFLYFNLVHTPRSPTNDQSISS